MMASKNHFVIKLILSVVIIGVHSSLHLSFGTHSNTVATTEAYDPPLRGMERVRMEWNESYVDDFRPMDLRLLMFTRIDE